MVRDDQVNWFSLRYARLDHAGSGRVGYDGKVGRIGRYGEVENGR